MLSPRAILDQYLELCSHDLSRLVYQLASNAVLEWNGLTVRGGPKIEKFLRQKQHAGQVQTFPGAVTTVSPFEVRDTHLATKTIPPENLASPTRQIPPRSSSPSTPISSGGAGEFRPEDLSFETPPKTLPAVPHPTAPSGGRCFLPFPSDDEEDNDDGAGQSSGSTSQANRQSTYSELHYLEAVGTIRTANEPKHRGTRTTHHIPREDASANSSGPSVATTSSDSASGEKRTKLKLSYRTHLRSQEVQFALIIYEHVSTRSTAVRRNLFVEEVELHQEESPPSRSRPRSPEPVPLPDSPPTEGQSSPRTPPVEPPGTPIKRRRVPPVIIGLRTSPRRTFAPDEAGSSIQQTWPRKSSSHSSTGGDSGGGGSASKKSKLSSASTCTIRKPLRF